MDRGAETGTQDGIVFQSPDFVLPSDSRGLFGIEQMLVKKHDRPDRNAVITGALLWDNEDKKSSSPRPSWPRSRPAGLSHIQPDTPLNRGAATHAHPGRPARTGTCPGGSGQRGQAA